MLDADVALIRPLVHVTASLYISLHPKFPCLNRLMTVCGIGLTKQKALIFIFGHGLLTQILLHAHALQVDFHSTVRMTRFGEITILLAIPVAYSAVVMSLMPPPATCMVICVATISTIELPARKRILYICMKNDYWLFFIQSAHIDC